MINLLPTDIKQNIFYARRNTAMVRWSIALVFFIVGLMMIVLAGQWFMQRSINTHTSKIATAREELKQQKLEENQKRIEEISKSVRLVLQVLSKEVLFSKLLRQLGSAIPEGVSLTQLQIDKLQGGLTINARATNIQAATQLQLNLQDPTNKIFEKADIESINCSSGGCTIQIKALFAKNNPFLLINNKPGATP